MMHGPINIRLAILYRMIQKEMSIFWEVMVSVIAREKKEFV